MESFRIGITEKFATISDMREAFGESAPSFGRCLNVCAAKLAMPLGPAKRKVSRLLRKSSLRQGGSFVLGRAHAKSGEKLERQPLKPSPQILVFFAKNDIGERLQKLRESSTAVQNAEVANGDLGGKTKQYEINGSVLALPELCLAE